MSSQYIHARMCSGDSFNLVPSLPYCSFPVTYCWCMVFPNSTTCTRVPEINSTSKGNITCNTVTEPQNQDPFVKTVNINLTMSGRHRIMANFSNFVDCQNESFPFNVYTRELSVLLLQVARTLVPFSHCYYAVLCSSVWGKLCACMHGHCSKIQILRDTCTWKGTWLCKHDGSTYVQSWAVLFPS